MIDALMNIALVIACVVNVVWALWYVSAHPEEGPFGEDWDW